jgi:RNA-directed DNA polymerase
MKTHKNLLPRVAAFENLVRAFGEASRGKRDQPDVQRFEFALEERLWEITRELEAERYQWGGYRAFWIFDPKQRLIRAAPFRDRVVHHALYQVLAPIVERGYITDSYACRVGRGSLAAVRRYEEYVRRQGGRGYVLKGDVMQYFPSVNHAVLQGLLRRKIGDARVLRLLDRLIASGDEGGGTGMPIGNLTSQLFANLYLDPLDHFVKEVLRRRFYIRYMDDFVILAEEKAELWEVLGAVEGFLLERLRLSLQWQRTSVTPVAAGVDFLGYVVFPAGHKRVRRRNVTRFRRRLVRLEAGRAQETIPFAHARQSIASWLGLARHASAFRLSRGLLLEHDVRNIGKRLLLKAMSGPGGSGWARRGRTDTGEHGGARPGWR